MSQFIALVGMGITVLAAFGLDRWLKVVQSQAITQAQVQTILWLNVLANLVMAASSLIRSSASNPLTSCYSAHPLIRCPSVDQPAQAGFAPFVAAVSTARLHSTRVSRPLGRETSGDHGDPRHETTGDRARSYPLIRFKSCRPVGAPQIRHPLITLP
jgi:hypothetical protein